MTLGEPDSPRRWVWYRMLAGSHTVALRMGCCCACSWLAGCLVCLCPWHLYFGKATLEHWQRRLTGIECRSEEGTAG